MSPKKLSEADKQEILKLYYQPEETTSTLASRYNVSSSTISRFLKSTLKESEYEELIQQKRLSRTNKSTVPDIKLKVENTTSTSESSPSTDTDDGETLDGDAVTEPKVEVSESPKKPIIKKAANQQLTLKLNQEVEIEETSEEDDEAEFLALEEILGEDIADDEDDIDEDYEGDWEENGDDGYHFQTETFGIEIQPLSEASVPRVCYLVVDRSSELITKPLKDFGDLGQIPAEEIQQKTLPVFDNHRIAKRFSNRSQRVIKIPDGKMLQKTGTYLEAKGITRLLIDGKVYSL